MSEASADEGSRTELQCFRLQGFFWILSGCPYRAQTSPMMEQTRPAKFPLNDPILPPMRPRRPRHLPRLRASSAALNAAL